MEKFDALESIQLLDKYRITHSQWVPTMFIRMLKLPEDERLRYDVSSQTIAIHAAAPIPVLVKEQMIDWWGPILFEYYAGTESNGLCAISSPEWLTHKGSVGRAMLGTIKVLDDDLGELPLGEVGTIYFADGVPFEYHNDPEKTAQATTAHGWTTLNDVGYLDEEGYLYLTDRKSNMIISGGVNIYPQESENVLVTHPRVLDVAVIGVPHDEFGEEVKGVVQLRDPAEASPALAGELIEFCRNKPGQDQVPGQHRLCGGTAQKHPPASCSSACSRKSTGRPPRAPCAPGRPCSGRPARGAGSRRAVRRSPFPSLIMNKFCY